MPLQIVFSRMMHVGTLLFLSLAVAAPILGADKPSDQERLLSAVETRFKSDSAALVRAIRGAKLSDEAARKSLLGRATEAAGKLDAKTLRLDSTFRAVLPMNEAHARLFAVQAELWRAEGRPLLSAAAAAPWEPLAPFKLPQMQPPGEVVVHTMLGEYRAGAVNVANASDRPMELTLSFEGLPGSPAPSYVTVHEVPWTDSVQKIPVAAALPEATREGAAWKIRVLPGLLRQVWFTFHVVDLPPGVHEGAVVLTPREGPPVRVPVSLHVYPMRFPRQPELLVGGWSYTNGKGEYAITPKNRAQFVKCLRDRFVNAPWASGAVFKHFKYTGKDHDQIEIDTRELDDWLAEWPDAKRYMVYVAIGYHFSSGDLDGAKAGTPLFDRRVKTWLTAYLKHLKSKGIGPERLGIMVFDEPHEGNNVEPMLAWTRAIRAAAPKVVLWNDPTYTKPEKAPREVFELNDVLCIMRPMWISLGKAYDQFFLDQQKHGKTLQFYSCGSQPRLLDPYSYYRLQAWECWRYGATGSFFWAFGDNRCPSSWNEYLAAPGPYTPLFIDPDHAITAKQMEAIREGTEDYQTLFMLRAAVKKAQAAGQSGPALKTAESLLQTAAPEVLDAPGANGLERVNAKDRGVADRVRIKVLKALAALQPGA